MIEKCCYNCAYCNANPAIEPCPQWEECLSQHYKFFEPNFISKFRHKVDNVFSKDKEKISYLIFGVLTTLVNFFAYWLAVKLGLKTVMSAIIAWFISVAFAIVTNKKFVFESKSKKMALLVEGVSFYLGRMATGALDVGIMYLAVDILNFDDFVMKIVSNIIVIILNYILGKFSFRKGIKEC